MQSKGVKQQVCRTCGFTYFHNAAVAVMAVLVHDSRILVIVRNRHPGKGCLDLPGGFVDPGESAEEALTRELHEELGIRISSFIYLGTAPNDYLYQDVLYRTCDLLYCAALRELPDRFDHSEIQRLLLLDPDEISEQDMAFASMKKALDLYRNRRCDPEVKRKLKKT